MYNTKLILSLLVTLYAVIQVTIADDNCFLTTSTHIYNFNVLKNQTFTFTDSGKNIYYFNVCGINQRCTAVNPNSGACQTGYENQMLSNCGIANQYVRPLANGAAGGSLLYTGGTSCKSGTISRSATIEMVCSTGPTRVVSAVETTTCKYVITLNSPLACGTPITTTTTTSTTGSQTTGSQVTTTGGSTTDKNIITTTGSITNQAVSTTGSIGTSTGRISTSGSLSSATAQPPQQQE
ncbi:hypothetical protein PPL_08077 [Heterostelium album PN500]|uniref:MRH domain-containing protein n=1 Tax=Heterostelium pallidum (strain ATCC 26659 / Pp 5 / PN500) TaxID=670386 RepID=D3BIJ8_HETP5|nr:hypothetical protein PPL_08077 [Heterostelium album PN500]EFA78622.1 hypothetical protein PPL_08077 [Heterostelium album PN500]|eukprot:XP_020430746.1 hypothetical protein PPL_08077 [Heterostelium album PN500]